MIVEKHVIGVSDSNHDDDPSNIDSTQRVENKPDDFKHLGKLNIIIKELLQV